jgi:hypothetical protein
VRVGVADAVAVAVAVGNIATGVAVGAGAHAANNMLKHTTLALLKSRGFIFPDPIHLKKTSLPLKRGPSPADSSCSRVGHRTRRAEPFGKLRTGS